MANYASLKAAIQDVIKTNGNNEITGALLQQSLLAMVNSLGIGYQYTGIATPATNPGTPDQNVFYLASTAGTYANFNGLVLENGEVAILKYNGAWSKDSTGSASLEKVNQLGQQVIYDVTANNDGATFASLAALLSSENLSTLIPVAVRCGGMSIRFVQSSDNKYVQYRLKANEWSATPSDWRGVTTVIKFGNEDLVESGAVASEFEEYVGIPREVTIDYTEQGTTGSRDVYYKVKKGWKVEGAIKNTSASTTSIYVHFYDANDSQIGSTQTFNGVAQDGIVNFSFISEDVDIEYIRVSISTRVVLEIAVSANKSEYLKDKINNFATDIYKNLDRRTALYTPTASTAWVLVYDSLYIKNGESFKINVSGSGIWNRISISTNGDVASKIYDNIADKKDTSIILTANTDITRLYFAFTYANPISITAELLYGASFAENEQLKGLVTKTNSISNKQGERHTTISLTPDTYTLLFDSLQIEENNELELIISSDVEWSRMNICTDSIGTNRLYDKFDTAAHCKLRLKANTDISSIYIACAAENQMSIDAILLYANTLKVYDNASAIKIVDSDVNETLFNEEWDYRTGDTSKVIDIATKEGEEVEFKFCNAVYASNTTIVLEAKDINGTVRGRVIDSVTIERGTTYSVKFKPTGYSVSTYLISIASGRTVLHISVVKHKIDNIENTVYPNDYEEGYAIDKWGLKHVFAYFKTSPLLRLNGSEILLKNTYYNGNAELVVPCVFYDENKVRLWRNHYYIPVNTGGFQDVIIPVSSIPSDAAYVKCTLKKDGGEICSGCYNDKVKTLELSIEDGVFLSNCKEYIIKSIAYRPLGELSKGYLCINADDGTSPVMSYTLPKFIEMDVPITFLIAKDAPIMINDSWRETFINAVKAEGSKIFIGQHGFFNWTACSESELYNFFKSEKAFFDSLEVSVGGAAQPTGYSDDIVEAMAGGLYGAVRGSWAMYDAQGNRDDRALYEWRRPICPPRSNMYCLTSCSIRDYSLAEWKEIIDYAIANKRLVNIVFHDFDLVERYPEDTSLPAIHTATPEEVAARKALIEGVVAYGKSAGIEFVSLGQVARLV